MTLLNTGSDHIFFDAATILPITINLEACAQRAFYPNQREFSIFAILRQRRPAAVIAKTDDAGRLTSSPEPAMLPACTTPEAKAAKASIRPSSTGCRRTASILNRS